MLARVKVRLEDDAGRPLTAWASVRFERRGGTYVNVEPVQPVPITAGGVPVAVVATDDGTVIGRAATTSVVAPGEEFDPGSVRFHVGG